MSNEITTVDLSNKRTFLPSELYLPEWARDTEFFRDICILINYVEDSLKDFSNEKYAEIAQAYRDIIFLYKDLTQLSEEAIRLLLRENGFGAVLDVINMDADKLQMLAIYLPLLKALKGTDIGFRYLLKVISHDFEIENWLENPKELDEYTYNVAFITFVNTGFEASIVSNFVKFSRSYVYPILKKLIIKVYYRSYQPFVHGRPVIQKSIKMRCMAEILVKLTINPTPADAIVTLTCAGYTQSGHSISVPNGSSVTWSVEAPGYISKSGTQQVNKDATLSVSLAHAYTITVNPTPADATVKLTCAGYTQIGNSITVAENSNVIYSVEEMHHNTASGTWKVTKTETKSVTLTPKTYTLTIAPSPSNATVKLTATGYTQSGNSITAPFNTSVSCEVSATGYVTRTKTILVVNTETLPFALKPTVYHYAWTDSTNNKTVYTTSTSVTTSTKVYSNVGVASTLTVKSVATNQITLSDNNIYVRDASSDIPN